MITTPMMPPLGMGLDDDSTRPAPDIEALRRAHDRTADAAAGFDKMAEKAEPHFRPVAERFLDLHRRHTAEIAALLRRAGDPPEGDGTVMGSINRAVVATRAFFTEIDEDVMGNVRRGEGAVLEAYEEAARAGLSETDRETMLDLHADLSALLAETRHLS